MKGKINILLAAIATGMLFASATGPSVPASAAGIAAPERIVIWGHQRMAKPQQSYGNPYNECPEPRVSDQRYLLPYDRDFPHQIV